MGNLVIIFGAVLAFFTISYASYRHEKKIWNKGICRECNSEWEYFDTDSQGGRGYKCQCDKFHTIWIGWFKADH